MEKDAAERKALLPREEEFIRLQEKLAALEDLRDKYRDLQSEIKEALAHKQSVETDLTRNLKLQEDLGRARARLAEIAHCREEEVKRREELSILSRQKEKQKEQESLQARKSSLEERLARRRSEWERATRGE